MSKLTSFGIYSSEIFEQDKLMSVQCRKVMKLGDTAVKREGQHDVLPISFKEKEPFLPDNRLMAEKRLASLHRKLARQPDMHEKYKEGISSLLCNMQLKSCERKSSTVIRLGICLIILWLVHVKRRFALSSTALLYISMFPSKARYWKDLTLHVNWLEWLKDSVSNLLPSW